MLTEAGGFWYWRSTSASSSPTIADATEDAQIVRFAPLFHQLSLHVLIRNPVPVPACRDG